MGRRARLALWIGAGLSVAIAVLAHLDLAAGFAATARIGWLGIGAVCALQAVSIALCALAWLALTQRGSFAGCALARWVREGASSVLGLVPGIGEFGGGRILKLLGTRGGDAAASTLVDVVMETISQALFTVVGVAVILGRSEAGSAGAWLGVAAASTLAGIGTYLVVRQRWVLDATDAVVSRLGRWFGADPRGMRLDLAGNVRRVLDRPGPVLWSAAIHFAAWFVGAAQVWIAAGAMGQPLGFGAASALLGTAYAARWIAFFVPLGGGVQEATFVVVGRLFGLDDGTAIALSLALRARDLALGVPAVLVWLAAEVRTLRRTA